MIYILNEILEILLRKYDISDERLLEFWNISYDNIFNRKFQFFKRFLYSIDKNYNSCPFLYFINHWIPLIIFSKMKIIIIILPDEDKNE